MTATLNRLILVLAIASLGLGVGLGLNACKQSEGEICQINDDCSSGLICNAATGKCQTPGAGVIDGGPLIDASQIDAPPIDAAVDAPVDAAPDV